MLLDMPAISIASKLITVIELSLISYLVSRILNLRKSIVPISIISIILASYILYNYDRLYVTGSSYFELFSLNSYWLYLVLHYYFFHSNKIQEKEIDYDSEKIKEIKDKKFEDLSNRFVNIVEGSGRELRTIITTIVGSIGLLRETQLTELQQEYLSDLEKSAENLTSFVNNIATFVKADLKAFELNETSTFKIESIFDNLIENYEILVDSNGKIDVIYDIDPDVPTEIVGDEKYLLVLLGCIIDNSVKFTNRGEIMLSCNLVNQSKDNCTLEISISDTGIGISEDKMPHIFTAMNNRKGNFWYAAGVDPGLGLPTAERLSRMFKNGNLTIESTVNKGTKVTFTATFKLPKYSKAKKRNKSRIAIISEKRYAHYMVKLLKRKGHMNVEKYEETEIEKFIESSKSAPPFDVIIYCTKSFRKDPIEIFLNKIKKQEQLKNTKIILICIKYLLERYSFDDHVDFYLIRPFLINQLYKHIKNCLQSKSSAPSKFIEDDSDSGKLTVLIAEDDIFNRQVLTKIVNRGGHKCIAVNNGLECLETYKNLGGKVDVIFMDYQMPSLDGLESTRLIRNYESIMKLDRTRIIGFTADENMKPKCIEAGMDDCLLKPVMVPKVYSVLRECANKS